MRKIIDVSTYQGVIDWDTVKQHIDGAILRVGYGDNIPSQDDDQFIRNANECTRLGIPFGVYIFSYAKVIEQVISEAEHVLRLIKDYSLSMPVFFDMEDSRQKDLGSTVLGDFAEKFCEIISNAGYKVGIYASKYWFTSVLTDNRFEQWDKWVAQYYSECTYKGTYVMWQYSSEGVIPGIQGRVDCNELYADYLEYNNKVEVTRMDAIINAAAIDTLGREAGADILQNCKGMSYDEAVEALKNTEEAKRYRVNKLYNILLFRNVDYSGLETFKDMATEDIVFALVNSQEYQECH